MEEESRKEEEEEKIPKKKKRWEPTAPVAPADEAPGHLVVEERTYAQE